MGKIVLFCTLVLAMLSNSQSFLLLHWKVSSRRGSVGEPQDITYSAGEQVVLPDVQVRLLHQPLDPAGEAGEKSEELYRGPVTLSIVYATFLDQNNELVSLTASPLPSGTSNTDAKLDTLRLFVDLAWPGMQQAVDRLQKIHQGGEAGGIELGGITFQLDRADGAQPLTTLNHLVFDSPQGGWISSEVNSPVDRIRVGVEQTSANGSQQLQALGSWEIQLVDMTPHLGKIRSGFCKQVECLPSDFLAKFNWLSPTVSAVPLLCPDQAANGVTIQKIWLEKRPVWSDFTRQSGFQLESGIPRKHLLMLQLSMNSTGRSFSLIDKNKEGVFEKFPLPKKILYDGRGQTIAIDNAMDGFHAIEQNFVLITYLPQDLIYQQALLVEEPFGPVWRLSCDGK